MMHLTIKRKVMLMMGFLVTLVPAVLVAALLYSYRLFGIEYFFDSKINAAVEQTVSIARLYLQEHKDNIKISAISVANNIEKNKHIIFDDKAIMQFFIDQLANARGLAEVMLFKEGFVIARNSLGLALVFESIGSDVLKKISNENDVIILEDTVENRVRAIAKVSNMKEDIYVLVGKYIDQSILDHLRNTEKSARDYKLLFGDLEITKKKLEAIFIFVLFVLFVFSIIVAKKFSSYITDPLDEISNATIALQEGNFTVRVPERKLNDEISALSKAFNAMVVKISEQTRELIIANDINNLRRQFIEVILTKISVGVLAVDGRDVVVNHNVMALELLEKKSDTGSMLVDNIFPEIKSHILLCRDGKVEHQIENLTVVRKKKSFNLFVKIGLVVDYKGDVEYVIITFSDITNIIYNQKMTAWADVARRVAHEIKNPLTPIYLAAERLKRRYHSEIKSDPESFVRYIDTIMSHVQSIEAMASDFVDFARIATPKIERNNIIKIIEEAVLLQKLANPSIKYHLQAEDNGLYVDCDYGQIIRVMNNLLVNASDAIKSKHEDNDKAGIIRVYISKDQVNSMITINVTDNGCGINQAIISRISEPYVTTKGHGTGLGLAIVQKIIEEHSGKFFINNVENGATACFTLPLSDELR